MWYRKAQVQPGVAQNNQPVQTPAETAQPVQTAPPVLQQAPAPTTVDQQTAVTNLQNSINTILSQTGKTYLQIISELNNLKTSNESNQTIDQNTKNNINTILDASITSVTTSAAGNFNKPFVPANEQGQQINQELIDVSNPAARLINPTNSAKLPGQGGLLMRDAIQPKVIEPKPTAVPAGAQNPPQEQKPLPGTSSNKATK